MRYETVTQRIGEYLGPIDWSYDFTKHDWGPSRGGVNPQVSRTRIELLRTLEANPAAYIATTDGGSPKVGWKQVLAVGMYDGWPFWSPTPSVQIAGMLSVEWHPWYSITAIEKR